MKASENKWAKRATKISDAIGVRANAVGEKFGAERKLRGCNRHPRYAGATYRRLMLFLVQASGLPQETATSS